MWDNPEDLNKSWDFVKPMPTFKGTFDLTTLYAVVINSDGTEGKGHSIIYCYCKTYEDADIISYGKDVMGSKGKVWEVAALVNKVGSYYSLQQEIKCTTLRAINIKIPTCDEIATANKRNTNNRMAEIKGKLSIEEINFLKRNRRHI